MTDDTAMRDETKSKGPALVFGVSGEQGRVAAKGFLDFGYSPVYGVTRTKPPQLEGAELILGDVSSVQDVERILLETKAQAIFLVTTTEMPVDVGGTGFHVAMEDEYQVIVNFFRTLIKVHDQDGLERHVVFSTLDNVQGMCQDILELTGKTWITPLDDGSIVPHYSGTYCVCVCLCVCGGIVSCTQVYHVSHYPSLSTSSRQGTWRRRGYGNVSIHPWINLDTHYLALFA